MSRVPGATRALDVLRLLSGASEPMTAVGIARALRLPRSSTYHLLDAMREAGFVVHLPDDGRWGLGVAAFEVGAAYARHDPLVRLAEPYLAALVRDIASPPVVSYLAVLHGAETLYLAKRESRRIPIVTEVGVRLPAALTASGRAILAALPPAQVRANFASPRAFVDRTGRGPQDLRALRTLLRVEAEQGYAEEDGFISDGYASLAVAVRNHVHHPVAALGLTFAADGASIAHRRLLVGALTTAAQRLSARLGER